jgi:hypothetical protein
MRLARRLRASERRYQTLRRGALSPSTPTLRSKADLSQVAVSRSPVEGPEIEERYSISEYGTVELTILDRESGYEQHYKIAG